MHKTLCTCLAMTELILIDLLNDDFLLNDSHYDSIYLPLTLFPPPFSISLSLSFLLSFLLLSLPSFTISLVLAG